ncbi:wax ester/triacylglycerol synthase family O-acyltransferase [Piscinibacter sakaiensis]|nr:wax ester/triacylglycerol synthase family O-acyltransferase [Piscinibacter sakaiensis]
MSRVDTAWLRMDNDVNLMMIVGVWLLQPGIAREDLVARIEDKLLKYGRFRQKVVEDAVGARWVDDEDFDVGHHLVQLRLHPRAGQDERGALQELVGELTTTPLNAARPLWQFHLIDDYEGGSALVARVHHCIADGIALISVMLSITDGGADPPSRRRRRTGGTDDAGDWLGDLVRPLSGAVRKAVDLTGQGVERSLALLTNPQALPESMELARVGVQVVSDLAALALMADDTPTRLKGRPAGSKRVAWGEPIPLDRVKAVGKALGGSVNDVLLACVAGAFGAYLRRHGDATAGCEIRAMVPVNLRPMSEAWKLGNRFGLVPLVLPLGIDNPVERVYAVRARMAELKGSYQPLLAFGLLSVAGLLVKPVQEALLGLFAKKATAVMTNVPGPAAPLRLCGATLKQTMFWVPQSGDIGLGVSILSYAGGVQFGLIADKKLCPDPQAVIAGFEPEFERLLTLTLMLPWGAAEAA